MDEWDAIPLSRLSHAGFCLRRAALLTNEQLWSENADTAKGRAEHGRVHTQRVEKRGDSAKLYEYPVFSQKLGVFGFCDCIEANSSADGCMIPCLDYPAALFPVEYKHGKLREENEYELQLCGQAMCLEEMYQTHIPRGAIFYISSHRRYEVEFSEELRTKVIQTIHTVDALRKNFSVPPAEYSAKCKKCSLYEQCMPRVSRSAIKYCEQLHTEAKEDFEL